MSPKSLLKRIGGVWGPKMRGAVGSLYDIVQEEEDRLRKLAEGHKDIQETPGMGNRIYTRHTMVVDTVDEFKTASSDFISLMKSSQRGLYSSMSTWVGRPEDPLLSSQIIHLKGLSFSDSLAKIRGILQELEGKNPEETRILISHQLGPLYEELSKLSRKLDRMGVMMDDHLRILTPIMIQYSGRDLPFIRKQDKGMGGRGDKDPPLTYDVHFDGIVSEKSRSVMALTESSLASVKLFRPPFLSRTYYTFTRILKCSNKSKTRFLRPPSLRNKSVDEDRDDLLEFRKSVDEQLGQEWEESMTLLNRNQLFPSQTNSFCHLNKEVREALRRRGVSIPPWNNPDSDLGNWEKGRVPSSSLVLSPNHNRVYAVIPKAVEYLTKEDIELGNTHEFATLHARTGVVDSDSSTCALTPVSSPPTLSSTFSPEVLSPLLECTNEVKLMVWNISGIVREMEGNFYSLPYHQLQVDPDTCIGFHDLLTTIRDKVKLLDLLPNFKIYLEEEITLTGGVRSVYLEALKFTELSNSFSRMVKGDQELLFQIITHFHGHEVGGLCHLVDTHNERIHELKRCAPLQSDFRGVFCN